MLLVPVALSVRKTEDGALAVGWAKTNPLPVRLEVGHRMVVGTPIPRVRLVVERGLTLRCRLVNPEGEPCPGVEIKIPGSGYAMTDA